MSLHITSLDELMKFMKVSYSPGLPAIDPEGAHLRYVRIPQAKGPIGPFYDGDLPEASVSSYETYMVDMLRCDDRRMYVWRKV